MTPRGFRYGAVEAAVKKPGRLDLGLIWADRPCAAAGVFTTNRVVAAPVLVCRERLGRGNIRGVLVNSGNANACTGQKGLEEARKLADRTTAVMNAEPDSVLPCSTGVIGLPLPVERMEEALPRLRESLGDDPTPLSQAILTTDSFPKVASRSLWHGDHEVRILGIAKGAGMIRPDMATMLAFLTTDARISPPALQSALDRATEASFNRITVDGDTSTNDSVLVLASGMEGPEPLDRDPAALRRFEETLAEVCRELARMIVRDGEGATKVVDVRVTGAVSDDAALLVARTIAESPLVKTAIHGEDPNWGRIAGALGRSGATAAETYHISIGGVPVVRAGLGLGSEAETEAHEAMRAPEFEIAVTLEEGRGSACVVTCDLTAEYVRINADYRT